nr:MFS transporter [Paenibacillus caui]
MIGYRETTGKHARFLVPYIICLGAFLSNLSAGMFNIALVDIAADFGTGIGPTQWVITVYLLVITVCLPVMGKLGDSLGKRKIHNAGYFIFMLGAFCCAWAPSFGLLVVFRMVQGLGASMYQATNMALIVSVFPNHQRGKALGLISTFVAGGSMAGPSLGGLLIEWFSWRLNFWLLATVAAVAWLLAQRLIPRDGQSGHAGLDLTGAALFAAAVTGLVTALSIGSRWGWTSPATLLLLLLFCAGMTAFALWCRSPRWGDAEERAGKSGDRTPFIKPELLRDPGSNTGIMITIASYMSAFAVQLLLPVFLRTQLGVSPAGTGLIMMGYPLALILSAPLSGSRSDKNGPLPWMAGGMTVMAASLAALGFLSPSFPPAAIVVLIVLMGAAMGMISSPNNSLVMSRTPPSHMGLISSLLALSRNLGMMFGTAAAGALLSNQALSKAAGQAGLSGYRTVFTLCSLLVIMFLLLLLFFFRQARRKRTADSSSIGL